MVAAEFGIPAEEFAKRLRRSTSLSRLLGSLQTKGGTVQRQVLQTAFPEIVREFELGKESGAKSSSLAKMEDWQPFAGHTGAVTCIAFSPDGHRAVSGSEDRTLRLWEIETGRELKQLTGHNEEITAVAFAPDGRRVIAGSRDRTLRLWDVESHRE